MQGHRNIHLVLSGGGARGLAHIGVIKRLCEHGYRICSISASSAGSIIGLLVCSGIPLEDIEQICTDMKFRDLVKFDLSGGGWMNFSKLDRIIKKHVRYKSLEDLPIALYVSTTDLHLGNNILYHQGDIAQIIKASCSIPFTFKPIKYDHRLLVDGGVSNNFPIEPFMDGFDIQAWNTDNHLSYHRTRNDTLLLGIDVNPYKGMFHARIQEIVTRSIHISIQQSWKYKKDFCDHYLQVYRLTNIKLFDTSKSKYMIRVGYQVAQEQRGDLLG